MNDYEGFDPDIAYEAQCEDREEFECEYWYMNLKDRDFIERDSATMNSKVFITKEHGFVERDLSTMYSSYLPF